MKKGMLFVVFVMFLTGCATSNKEVKIGSDAEIKDGGINMSIYPPVKELIKNKDGVLELI